MQGGRLIHQCLKVPKCNTCVTLKEYDHRHHKAVEVLNLLIKSFRIKSLHFLTFGTISPIPLPLSPLVFVGGSKGHRHKINPPNPLKHLGHAKRSKRTSWRPRRCVIFVANNEGGCVRCRDASEFLQRILAKWRESFEQACMHTA